MLIRKIFFAKVLTLFVLSEFYKGIPVLYVLFNSVKFDILLKR